MTLSNIGHKSGFNSPEKIQVPKLAVFKKYILSEFSLKLMIKDGFEIPKELSQRSFGFALNHFD